MLKPTLPGLTWLVVLTLVLVAAAVTASSLLAPVAAALARSETKSGERSTPAFVVLTMLSSVLLIVGLGLLQFPIGCATHALLVSAALPPSTEMDEGKLAATVRAEAEVGGRLVRDLAPLRDAVLERLLPLAGTTVAPEEIARVLREEIADASRSGFPAPQPDVRVEAAEQMDPSLIESVEVGVLMGWRALYSGDNQHITFAVSSRATAYGWDWNQFARLPIFSSTAGPTLSPIPIGAGSEATPMLSQVIHTSVSASNDRLAVDILINTNGAAGNIVLALPDLLRGGAPLRAVLSVPSDAGPTFLSRVTFEGRNDFARASRLQQIGADDNVVATRALPPRRLDVVRLDLQSPDIRPTLDYLAGRTAVCSMEGDVSAQITGWRDSFARREDFAPLLGAGSRSEVMLRVESSGVLLVLPTAPGPWPAGPLSDADQARLGLAANPIAPFGTPTERFVTWTATDRPQRYDLDRLGIDGEVLPGTLALIDPDGTTIVRMAAASHEDIASRRLTRENPARVYVPSMVRVGLPDRIDPTHHHQATIVLGDPKSLGVLCGFPIPEAELFFAYWRRILEAITAAAVPAVTVSTINATPSLAGPTIYLNQPALDQIASARLEWPLLMVTIATAIFVVFVIIAYARAVRDFRSH
jgi:hypothetical protein